MTLVARTALQTSRGREETATRAVDERCRIFPFTSLPPREMAGAAGRYPYGTVSAHAARVGVSRFEDLRVWQLAKQYCDLIFEITERPEFRRESVLGERMRKTGVQIVEEIAEGFERETRRDFANFARMAKGSNGEARAQLYVAKRYLREGEFEKLLGINMDIGKMLRGLRHSLLGPAPRV